jgi:hypothetical protein
VRWTYQRKAKLIEAINDGFIEETVAMSMHEISKEELSEWRKLYEAHGAKGLTINSRQRYRAREAGGGHT